MAQLMGWPAEIAFLAGVMAGTTLAGLTGLLALRTTGVSFMIVTLMFSQAAFMTVLYFGEFTRGDEGFVIPQAARQIFGLDLSDSGICYGAALVLFSVCLGLTLWLARSATGRVMVASRENEERTRMLGYNPFRTKLLALAISDAMSGAAGERLRRAALPDHLAA